ncbi:RagB/SusD family nutrient uptake outer membrane protein [Wenyingzhuangia aestuarii]|uniref:RagB/SusD family nutrient uptake outer membrane protein n=1 Tax=Wenyingzhuangia aestuarii TaxID=1647582 RepID=UPI0014388790|nr:RagB/SusD family nutrient uptake outer membrane protein [Wenyingzhuangia aestuarii]NJB83682.1 hypothetical protein [Wenyingzhuangia aestuarii]
MKKLIKYTYLSLLVTIIYSCDDYIDIAPHTGDTIEDFSNRGLESTEQALVATYSSLIDASLYDVDTEAFRSDIAYPGRRDEDQNPNGFPWYNKQFSETTPIVESKWKLLYDAILRANIVMESLNNIKPKLDKEAVVFDLARWKSQMAQARFLRGLFYFYLHSSYNNGSVVIRDKSPKGFPDYAVPLSSSADVIAFYTADLEYAKENLATTRGANKAIPTKGTVLTILGMSNLYEAVVEGSIKDISKIDAAIENFESVINDFDYELERDFDLLFTTAGEFNKESILEVSYTTDGLSDDGSSGVFKLINSWATKANADGNSNYTPAYWMIDEYSKEPVDPLNPINETEDEEGNVFNRTTSWRASTMIALAQDSISSFYGGAKPIFTLATNQTKEFYSVFKKYTNHDILTSENDLPSGKFNSGKNVIVNRLSEVHLMLAECYIYKNQIDKALLHINKIRERWGLVLYGAPAEFSDGMHTYDNQTYDAASLMDKLMYIDKPLETCLEGHSVRSIDLRRWGITQQRFQDLSTRVYGTKEIVYTGKNIEGVVDTVEAAMIISDADADFDPLTELDDEYTEAAANYSKKAHAYLPIPLNEKTTNGAVN